MNTTTITPPEANTATTATPQVLSAQEAAIASGKKIMDGTVTDRVLRFQIQFLFPK